MHRFAPAWNGERVEGMGRGVSDEAALRGCARGLDSISSRGGFRAGRKVRRETEATVMRRWWLALVVCVGVSVAAPALAPQPACAWWAEHQYEVKPVDSDPDGPFFTGPEPPQVMEANEGCQSGQLGAVEILLIEIQLFADLLGI